MNRPNSPRADLSRLPNLPKAGRRLAWIAIGSVVVLLSWTATDLLGQPFKKVNEACDQVPCESGLYCVQTKDGKKKCAACDQSKLNSLTGNVDSYCKTFGEGWTPASSAEYQAALADDGRVLVDVLDTMLESAKRCREAREYREGQCWSGGDDEHKGEIKKVGDSIDRISAHKTQMIGARRVYYGSKSTYQSKLSTFRSKCDLNFPDINQKLAVLNSDQDKKNKVSCSDIEKYANDCERCFNSAKDLLNDGFSGSTSKFPEEYSKTYSNGEDTMKKAQELLKTVKSKNLCN
jgi:hypothetical protein